MAQVINTNIASLTAQRTLAASQKDAATAMQRLSSGLRINSAKDDAAGLAIGNRLTAQINGINQAIRNANDGLSVSQVSEGALSETSDLLQRMRELAVQSANASNSSSDRTALQTEVGQLIAEMDRISTNTKFGNVNLLDGTFTSQSFQVGANASETLSVTIASAASSSLGATTTTSSAVTFGNFRSANVGTVAGTPSSDVTAQTLSLVSNGSTTNIAVAADATAATIATSFNAAQTDVVAAAFTGVRIDINDSASGDTLDLTINGTTLSSIDITSDANSSNNIAAAITGNTTLAATLSVTDNGDGTVDIVDTTGADITIDDLTLTESSGSALDATLQALTAAGTVVGTTQAVASGSGAVVTGHLAFTSSDASKSYALFSSDGSGGVTSATTETLGAGVVENMTFNNFNTANAGDTAATADSKVTTDQTLTFVIDGASQSIAVSTDDSAAAIATEVNNNVSGVSAAAITTARVTGSGFETDDGDADKMASITINGVKLDGAGSGYDISTAAEFGTNLAAAINGNEQLSKTLTAVDNGDGSFDVIDSTGANIIFDDIDFTDVDGTGSTGTANLAVAVRAIDAAGAVAGDSESITDGHGTIVTGDILFNVDDTSKSYQMFTSASSGSGVTTATTSADGVGTAAVSTSTTGSVSAVDISTVAGATSALATIDAALTTLDSQRATLGAVQNRFDSVISNLSNVSENTSAARSRIMDADFAAETAQLARTQILQQAGISVLAQANAQPQNVLALLQ